MRVSLGPAYRYLEAEDGVQALALARELRPELVLLDLMLPRLTGLEVLARLCSEPRLAATAVIVVTAQPALLEQARTLGADESLVKPFEPERLAAAAALL